MAMTGLDEARPTRRNNPRTVTAHSQGTGAGYARMGL